MSRKTQGLAANGVAGIAKQIDDGKVRYSTGASRSGDAEKTRFDLISPVAMRRLAETYAEGAGKHGDRNWEAGMPASDVVNHLLAHVNLWLAGDRSEDHLAHACWGLAALMHFEELRPECIDIPSRQTADK